MSDYGPLQPPTEQAIEVFYKVLETNLHADMRPVPNEWLLKERGLSQKLSDRIAELEVENAELKAAATRAAILLNDATYHDGRYDQHTSPEWQKEACEVADILERLAPQPPHQEEEK